MWKDLLAMGRLLDAFDLTAGTERRWQPEALR